MDKHNLTIDDMKLMYVSHEEAEEWYGPKGFTLADLYDGLADCHDPLPPFFLYEVSGGDPEGWFGDKRPSTYAEAVAESRAGTLEAYQRNVENGLDLPIEDMTMWDAPIGTLKGEDDEPEEEDAEEAGA